MLGNQESRYDNTPQDKQQNTFAEILKRSIKDFTKWPAKRQILAVGVVGGIFFGALPVLSTALPFAVLGVVAALTLYFAVQIVSYAIRGVKYSARKIKEGAEYSINQVKKGTNYLGQRTKDGVNYTAYSLKKGTSHALYNMADTLYNAAGETNYLEKIKEFTMEQKNQSNMIKEKLKGIKRNSPNLIANILSGIVAKIDLKLKEEQDLGWIEHTDRWIEQKKFINKLDAEKLQILLIQRVLPKDSYFIDSIFSEHYSEIMEVITDCQESDLFASSKRMFDHEKAKSGKVLPRDLSHIFSLKEQEVHNGSSEATPFERPSSKDVSISDSFMNECFKELEKRGYTSTPKPKKRLVNKFEEMNSSDGLAAMNDRFLSVSARSSFSFDSGNESASTASTNTDNKKEKYDLVIGELKERRNSFPTFKPTSKIDVHTVMQQQGKQIVS